MRSLDKAITLKAEKKIVCWYWGEVPEKQIKKRNKRELSRRRRRELKKRF